MKTALRPSETDITLHIHDANMWRAECPTRQRGKLGFQGTIGLAAGLLLLLVGGTGVFESLVHPDTGARLFFIGWLGPLAVIGALIVWYSVRMLVRLWQTEVIESDGVVLTHARVGGPFAPAVELELPLERIEPFDPPIARTHPDAAGDQAPVELVGPLVIRYRVANEETVYEHPCFMELTCAERKWIADTLNPFLAKGDST